MDKITQQYERRQLRILSWPSVIVALGLVLCSFSEAFPQGPTPDSTLAAGYHHTCAVLTDGQVKCWGYNLHGELGDGTTSYSLVPVSVKGLTNGKAVAGGYRHSCVVLRDGGVKCWGMNDKGQLGDGTTSNSTIPVSVTGITNAVGIGSGGNHTCVALDDGHVKCWGRGVGQLPDGTTSDSTIPVPVTGITNAVAIAGGTPTCAVLADGSVECWDGSSLVPETISGITKAIAVSVGTGYSCAVLADGRVQCWGFGQLGNETTTLSWVPLTVTGVTNAVGIAAGRCDYSCVLLADGQVKCWGHDHFSGPQKQGALKGTFRIPVTIPNITNAVAIAAGDLHTCVLLADGRVQCWGHKIAGPMLGNTIKPRLPAVGLRFRQKFHGHLVTVKGLDNFVAVAPNVQLSAKIPAPAK